MATWPAWARFLASEEQARRRRIKQERKLDVQSLDV
jgi:hypothetical protein